MNFLELEKKCKRRRLRIKIFYILGVVFFIFSLIVSGLMVKKFLFSSNEETPKGKVVKKEPKQQPKPIKVKKEESKPQQKAKPQPQKIKPAPQKKEEDVINPQMFNVVSDEKMRGDIFIKPDLSFLKEYIKHKPKKEIIHKKEVTHPKTHTNTKKVLKTTTLSFEECMKKSEYYYNHNNYIKALEWAKNANLIDKDRPESWIMTAKIFKKMGKKEEALAILNVYYSYHKNEEVKKMIGELSND